LVGSGDDHGTVSASNTARNSFGSIATVTDPTVSEYFNFDSADSTAAWPPGLQSRVHGSETDFNAVIPIHSAKVTVGTAPLRVILIVFRCAERVVCQHAVGG
jgi:hypothetical protein